MFARAISYSVACSGFAVEINAVVSSVNLRPIRWVYGTSVSHDASDTSTLLLRPYQQRADQFAGNIGLDIVQRRVCRWYYQHNAMHSGIAPHIGSIATAAIRSLDRFISLFLRWFPASMSRMVVSCSCVEGGSLFWKSIALNLTWFGSSSRRR